MRSDRARYRTLGLVLALALASGGCTALDNALATVPFFAFLRYAPFFDPYEAPRPAPAHSVPYETPAGVVLPPPVNTQAGLVAFGESPAGRNPYSPTDSTVLALGQMMFERDCAVCHGPEGNGNGIITQGTAKFPPIIPPLNKGNALTLSDGYIYGIIRGGRGLMPAYGTRIDHVQRWAIVNYVRHLQQQVSGGAAAPAAAQPR